MQSKEFKNIESKVSKLVLIFEKYTFEDLAKACFSINVYKLNKSCQESQMALNLALFRTRKFGKKRICTYNEFIEFYNFIREIIGATIIDDYIVEDFGEVRIAFDDGLFRILIGTGYSHSYIVTKLLIEFSKNYNKVSDLKKVLNYLSSLLEFFQIQRSFNVSNNIDMSIPTEEIFNLTKKFFDEFANMPNIDFLLNLFQSEYIEHTYFIKKDKIYPLYNVGILISLWNNWVNSIDFNDNILLNKGLLYKYLGIIDSFHDVERTPVALFPVVVSENGIDVSNERIDFALMSEKGIVLGIQAESCDEDVVQLVQEIENRKMNGDLCISENRIYVEGKKRVIGVNKNCQIYYLIYNSYNNPSLPYYNLVDNSCYQIYTYFDVYGMLLYATSVDEILEFIKFDKKQDNVFEVSFGGKICKFLAWKKNNHVMQIGAIDYSISNFDFNIEDQYLFEFFKQNSEYYPFLSNQYLFNEPFVWEITRIDNNVFQYVKKYHCGFGGLIISLNNKTILFAQNAEILKECNYDEEIQIISVIDDVVKNFIKENIISNDILKYRFTEILYIPETVFEKNVNVKMEGNYTKYCYRIEDNNCYLNYTINKNKLLNDIHEAQDREVEVKNIIDLFSIIIKDEHIDYFKELLSMISNKKKTVSNLLFKINYYYNTKAITIKISDEVTLNVENKLARLVKYDNFAIGEYSEKVLNKILRKLIDGLINDMEMSMSKYHEYDLHIVLLSCLSSITHQIYVEKLKYGSFKDLDDAIKVDLDTSIIEERENNKELYRAIMFCIETNLSTKHTDEKNFSKNDLIELIALSKKVISLNDFAELSVFMPDMVSIKINNDFTISQFVKNETHNENVIRNRYNAVEYPIQNIQENNEYIDKINVAFSNNYGFSIADLSDACMYLMKTCDRNAEQISYNVFKISIVEFCEELRKICNMSREKIYKILLYLCIDRNKIKVNKNGASYIEINERKGRFNRFEIRNIVNYGDFIIFSPAVVANFDRILHYGIFDFYLPYEEGIENIASVIKEWKTEYEKRMPQDIAKLFSYLNPKLKVYYNIDLSKHFKSELFKVDLGDYDVLVFDIENKIIWNIESKVILKKGRIPDLKNENNSIKEYIKKFKRRIDYLQQNCDYVLNSFGINDRNFTLKSYMVFNKVVSYNNTDASFKILCFGEIKNIIEEKYYRK